ncbi:hypothetical protein A9Q84_06045 [Halobacteriovorax marinus]|uniref:histidine kinase n=1 Tax=Halobacteriovorax marinus TaxID=97084 RepID=A0A1Y5F994_9BACT|nr:hypothetical protein A9Q84_06045 [Halobacteriovorax marinus]
MALKDDIAVQEKLPSWIVYSVILLCILPWVLNQFGITFESANIPFDFHANQNSLIDHRFLTFKGPFTHALLEWGAFSLAILTCFMAFTNYAIKKDPATPIIGVALLCAGLMDAFHTLAAIRLIEASAPNKDLIPFTWALCRLFNSIICVIGVGIFLNRKKSEITNHGPKFIMSISLVFLVIAYSTITICATSSSLPQTQFPGAMITRPWDVYPFFIFIVGAFFFYKFYRKFPSSFSHALIVSTVPDLATQVYMALGSSALFDNAFNIAHFLKIIAYAVPFTGLCYDYIYTNKRAVEADRIKSEFLASMSHEIRTPMNAIIGFSNELSEKQLKQDEQEEMIELIKDSSLGLLRIINDVLDFSKIESDKLTLEVIQFELRRTIEQTMFIIDHQLSSRKITLKLNFDESTPQAIEGDPGRIRQVLLNLLSNSAKFTRNGEISVSVYPETRGNELYIHFKVKDTGIGMSEAEQKTIFQRFTQADQSTTRKYGGTGLGLAISKNISLMMGGDIKVHSEKGVGSTFHFWIKTKEVNYNDLLEQVDEIKQEEESFKLSPINILLVEDNVVNQKLAMRILKRMGHEPDLAENGFEAIEAVHKKKYDIIFMDLQMPEMGGLEATAKILDSQELDSFPTIVAMSANVFKEDIDACVAVGMKGFIPKPIMKEKILEVLTRIHHNKMGIAS